MEHSKVIFLIPIIEFLAFSSTILFTIIIKGKGDLLSLEMHVQGNSRKENIRRRVKEEKGKHSYYSSIKSLVTFLSNCGERTGIPIPCMSAE